MSFETAPSLVLASDGQLSSRSVANWKSGSTEPGADALRELHRLGCNVTWLVTGEGEMFSDSSYGRDQARKAGAKQPTGKQKAASQSTKAPAELIADLEAVIKKWR